MTLKPVKCNACNGTGSHRDPAHPEDGDDAVLCQPCGGSGTVMEDVPDE